MLVWMRWSLQLDDDLMIDCAHGNDRQLQMRNAFMPKLRGDKPSLPVPGREKSTVPVR
jgi:hypothetical protein